MTALTVSGVFFVVVSALVITFRHQYVKLVHAFLTFFLGGAVADDSVRPNAAKHTILVGLFGIGFGAFMIINSLYFQ